MPTINLQWLLDVKLDDSELAIRAQVLKGAAFVIGVLALAATPLGMTDPRSSLRVTIGTVALALGCLAVFLLARRRAVLQGGFLLTCMLLGYLSLHPPDLLLTRPHGTAFFIPVLVAGLVAGSGPALLCGGAALAMLGLVSLFSGVAWTVDTLVTAFIIAMGTGLLWLIIRTLEHFRAQRATAEQGLYTALGALSEEYARAEQARREHRAVFDATSEAMVLVAPDATLLTVNRRFTELFGIAESTVVGRQVTELQTAVERIFVDPKELRELVAGSVADFERRFTTMIAQQWPVTRDLELFSTAVQGADTKPIGRLYVFRDITREREIDRMKSDFVALASHELRTPLNAINGFVSLLLEDEAGPLSPQQRHLLTTAKRNSDRLTALVTDLLDISRIEAGKMELQHTLLPVPPLIRHVVALLQADLDAKQQRLTLDLPAAIPPVSGDPDRVVQILVNLVSNATKYTPAGGEITIAVRVEPAHLRVDVRDTGVGLSAAEQAQIFTKFYRAQNHLTQAVRGTGLGLAMTQSLVHLHGGTIAVCSRPGEGSTFSFTLPLVPAAERAAPELCSLAGHEPVAVDARPG